LLIGAGAQLMAQDGFVKTPKGNLLKNLTNKTGDKIKVNDVITFDIVQKTDKDSLLGSSYTSGQPIKIQVQEPKTTPDLMDVFPLLAAQDSACVKVPTDSIFKGHDNERPPFFPKGSYLVCYVKIERIQTLDEAMGERNKALDSMRTAETAARSKFVAGLKGPVKTTKSGLQYIITQPSLKARPLAGDTVVVEYAGKFLDGTLFDTSIKDVAMKSGKYQEGRPYEPLKFPVGAQKVIPGWDEGLMLLGSGAKATFIIPSNLAYGDQGYNGIPPFATLVFDVELKGIHPIKHAAPKPAVKKPVTKKPAAKKTAATAKKN